MSVENLNQQELQRLARQDEPTYVNVSEFAVEVLGGLTCQRGRHDGPVAAAAHPLFPESHQGRTYSPTTVRSKQMEHLHEGQFIPEVRHSQPPDDLPVRARNEDFPACDLVGDDSLANVQVQPGQRLNIALLGVLGDRIAAHDVILTARERE